ncbi:hypothetical protein Tco_0692203 [Tanacetum coccineum]
MAAHTERMKRFENAIFKQREEINDMMTEMFRLLKELTTSKTPEKVLIREEAKFLVTKNINSISLAREKEERSDKMDVTPDNTEMPTKIKIPMKEVEMNNEAECEPIKTAEEEEMTETLRKTKRGISLGTPFLTTAKAVIKFDKGTITLRSRKSKISFNRIHKSSCKIEKGVKNDIEPIAPIMTVNRLVLEWEERIKLHLEKEMKFNQWRSNNFKSKHATPVKVEGGMDDEGEVT